MNIIKIKCNIYKCKEGMIVKMIRQSQKDNIDLNANREKEFAETEVSLEKIVSILIRRLDIDNKLNPIIMYEDPFSFYVSTNENGCELKLTAHELLVSCNSIEDDDPYFLDVPDMMAEMKDILGGDH